ncbi:MAG: HIT domain-containing protein [Spirochaetia bacterium]|nr:HIT domain-containing protein [Spirochaetia bacterium]
MKKFSLHSRLKEDTFFIGNLALSQVLLMNESRYPWVILVPQRNNIREIYELTGAEQLELAKESGFISKKMKEYFKADKMNIAALGNVVKQLHVHHIVRYENDAAWPDPVWGKFSPQVYEKNKEILMIEDLRELLALNIKKL